MELYRNKVCGRPSAEALLGRPVLVETSLVSPDRAGFYRGEIVVAEDSRYFSVQLLFADGMVARRFAIGWAARGERVLFSWDGRRETGVIAPQILRLVTPGLQAATRLVWTTVAAVRADGPAGTPVFFTAIGPFGNDDIVRIGDSAA